MTPDLLPLRFAAKVRIDADGCWIFTAAINSSGYGLIAVDGDGSTRLAHRASYELLVGPIPAGLALDHLCLVKRCVNPTHLEPVTSAENNRRAVAAGLAYPTLAAINATKKHCPQGHAYDTANTYISPKGHRFCITCRRASDKSRRLAVKAAAS